MSLSRDRLCILHTYSNKYILYKYSNIKLMRSSPCAPHQLFLYVFSFNIEFHIWYSVKHIFAADSSVLYEICVGVEHSLPIVCLVWYDYYMYLIEKDLTLSFFMCYSSAHVNTENV